MRCLLSLVRGAKCPHATTYNQEARSQVKLQFLKGHCLPYSQYDLPPLNGDRNLRSAISFTLSDNGNYKTTSALNVPKGSNCPDQLITSFVIVPFNLLSQLLSVYLPVFMIFFDMAQLCKLRPECH